MHSDESPPQRFVYEFLERLIESVPQLLDASSDIVVEREGRPHASKHRQLDASMSTDYETSRDG